VKSVAHYNQNLLTNQDRWSLRDFVTVSSEFYPQLGDYYRAAIDTYLDEWKAPAEVEL
jgi:hypothetical protein